MTVLIVASDKSTALAYAGFFSKREYAILTAHSGRQSMAQAKAHHLDAILVDVAWQHLDYKALCRKLKSVSFAPLVLIASPNAKIDGGIETAGVILKPVSEKKMVARIKAAIDARPPRLLTLGKLSLDLEKQKLARGSKTFSLTPKEFGLLRLLMEHPGQVITRKVLMKQVWETEYMGDTRTLDVHIRWLREKVEDNPSKPQRLVTARGEGYRIEKEA